MAETSFRGSPRGCLSLEGHEQLGHLLFYYTRTVTHNRWYPNEIVHNSIDKNTDSNILSACTKKKVSRQPN